MYCALSVISIEIRAFFIPSLLGRVREGTTKMLNLEKSLQLMYLCDKN